MKGLSKEMVTLGTTRSVIRELFEFGKIRAAQVGEENVFDFSIGNPSVPPPPIVTETLLRLLAEEDPMTLHGYTSAQGDLTVRGLLAADLSRRFGEAYTGGDLYLTAGAAAALSCCFQALTCPEDEFVVLAPYFPEYQVFIKNAGAEMVLVPARTEDFQIDFAALEQAITPHTKGVVVNSPNNPSGAVYSPSTCRRLCDLLAAKSAQYGHTIWLISDEPYREIVYGGVGATWLPSLYRDTLVCYSYSKSLSLPGERMGYVLVPPACQDAPLVYAAICGAGRSLGYICAPSLFQKTVALCADQTADLSVYAQNRDRLLASLQGMGFSCAVPDGAFYLFPQTLIPDDLAFCERAKDFDLLLVPGSGFGCPGHMRLSYCVSPQRIEKALPAFERLAAAYR